MDAITASKITKEAIAARLPKTQDAVLTIIKDAAEDGYFACSVYPSELPFPMTKQMWQDVCNFLVIQGYTVGLREFGSNQAALGIEWGEDGG